MKRGVFNIVSSSAVILLLLSTAARAQSLIVRDATVYTMANQSALQATDVMVRDGLILEIGSDLPVPADARVIEAAGRPLTPGLFAGASGLGLVEISLETATVDDSLALPLLRPEFDVTTAYNPHSTLIPITRIEGFTWTLLGARPSGSIVAGQGRPVLLDGGYVSFVGVPVLFVYVGAGSQQLSGNSRAAQWMLLNQAIDEARSEVRWSPQPLQPIRSLCTAFRSRWSHARPCSATAIWSGIRSCPGPIRSPNNV